METAPVTDNKRKRDEGDEDGPALKRTTNANELKLSDQECLDKWIAGTLEVIQSFLPTPPADMSPGMMAPSMDFTRGLLVCASIAYHHKLSDDEKYVGQWQDGSNGKMRWTFSWTFHGHGDHLFEDVRGSLCEVILIVYERAWKRYSDSTNYPNDAALGACLQQIERNLDVIIFDLLEASNVAVEKCKNCSREALEKLYSVMLKRNVGLSLTSNDIPELRSLREGIHGVCSGVCCAPE